MSTHDAPPKGRRRFVEALVFGLTCFMAGGVVVICIIDHQEASHRPVQTKGDILWDVMKNAPVHPPVDALTVKAAMASGQVARPALQPPDQDVPEPSPLTPSDLETMSQAVLKALRERDEPETFRNFPAVEQLNGTFSLMRSGASKGHFVETYQEPFFKDVRATVKKHTLTLSLVVPLRGDGATGTIEMAPSILSCADFGRLWRVAFNSARQQFNLRGYNLILRINPMFPPAQLEVSRHYAKPKNPQCVIVGMMRQDYGKIRWDSGDNDDFIQVHSNILQIVRTRLEPVS